METTNLPAKLKRLLLILASAALLLAISAYLLLQLSNSRTYQAFGVLVNRVETQQKIVALTFDDAPSSHIGEVLSTLQAKDIKATFYAIGKAIEEHPQEVKAIAGAGMEIGNHSYSHDRLLFQSQSLIDSEIQKTNSLIRNTGYAGEITFRPPNGKKLFGLPWYLAQHNITTIMWDVEPDTYVNLPEGDAKADALVSYTLQHTRPGSIILLHPFCDSCASDRRAVAGIVDGLQARGYRFVTVSEMLNTN